MTLSQALTDLIRRAAEAAGHGDGPVPLEPCVPTQNPDHGDYQSNHAFRLGKALRTNPRAVAEAMVAALPENDLIASAEVAGPGFINLRVTNGALGAYVQRMAASSTLGVPQLGDGKTLVIDFSSPNIAKRMHVGHLRSTIIGDALHRLYEATGWRVVADNHLGDWGTQFGMLIVGWTRWLDREAFEADPILELQTLYQRFKAEVENQPELLELARAETAKLQAGDPENRALWEQFCAASMLEFDTLYRRMGIEFDEVMGESAYREELQDLIDELLAKGTAEVSDGAVVIPFEATDGKGLAKAPLLIRKSDGAALYGTTDLATIRYRTKAHGPDKVIYVVDTRQQLHFRQIFAAARKMGFTSDFVHVWFGMLKFADGRVAATSKGGNINLVDVLDEAVRRAREIVDERSDELSEAERETIAETVGVGAVKYFDLSQNPQSDITFDWDRSLALNGNTAPYMMYAHARCCSVLRKADAEVDLGSLALEAPEEHELALSLARLTETVAQAAESCRPNLLADQLYSITESFGRFYGACRVIGSEQQASRLALTAATAKSLAFGLDLLGIGAPERM